MPFLKKEKPQGVVLVFVVDTRGVDFCFSCHKFQVSRGGKTCTINKDVNVRYTLRFSNKYGTKSYIFAITRTPMVSKMISNAVYALANIYFSPSKLYGS